MRTKLEDAVMEKREIEVEVEPALYGTVCDSCGRVFHMKAYCNDRGLARLSGIFDMHNVVDPATGKGLGNIFAADVCSLACAHELFANGGWRKLSQYKPYVNADAKLVRVEVCVTSMVLDEEAIRASRTGTTVAKRGSTVVIKDAP